MKFEYFAEKVSHLKELVRGKSNREIREAKKFPNKGSRRGLSCIQDGISRKEIVRQILGGGLGAASSSYSRFNLSEHSLGGYHTSS